MVVPRTVGSPIMGSPTVTPKAVRKCMIYVQGSTHVQSAFQPPKLEILLIFSLLWLIQYSACGVTNFVLLLSGTTHTIQPPTAALTYMSSKKVSFAAILSSWQESVSVIQWALQYQQRFTSNNHCVLGDLIFKNGHNNEYKKLLLNCLPWLALKIIWTVYCILN